MNDLADDAFGWLTQIALPLWLERGVDWRSGGFFDALSMDDARNCVSYKRLRVLCRQIHVFAEGARFGVPGAREAVRHGLDFLLGPAQLPDGSFANRFDLEGFVTDDRRDLYDLAFCLFALAHAYDVFPDAGVLTAAQKLLRFIILNLAHPSGGFSEGIPASFPRRQNPHMHLLEACLAWRGRNLDLGTTDLSDKLVALCLTRFVDPKATKILEYFGDELMPLSGEAQAIEPGHQFEWAWLLTLHAAFNGQKSATAAQLFRFGRLFGIDPDTGFLFAELNEDGSCRSRNCRLWPHTEWLKIELLQPDPERGAREALGAVSRFLDSPIRGLWHEQWNSMSGGFSDGPAPASTLYHLTSAYSELFKQTRLDPGSREERVAKSPA